MDVSTADDRALHWDRWPNAGTREEYGRLRMFERAFDRFTIAHLERLGVGPGWRCLEVGAGAGSIAGWLADQAGTANVIATELTTEFLAPLVERGLRVFRHDIAVDPPVEDEFDLIHARDVLLHLPSRQEVIGRLASWLAPGGWLLLEEAAFLSRNATHPLLGRVEDALAQFLAGRVGTDLAWPLTFPLPLERGGLIDVDAMVSSSVLRGGNALAAVYLRTMEASASGLLATGMVTAEDLAELARLCADPSVVDYSVIVIAGQGRRAPAP
jgi:SAM-dependent methyltransferase